MAQLEPLRREAIEQHGADSFQVGRIEIRMAEPLAKIGEHDRAIAMLLAFVSRGERTNDVQSLRQPVYRARLASMMVGCGRLTEAATQLDIADRECPAGESASQARSTIAAARAQLLAARLKDPAGH